MEGLKPCPHCGGGMPESEMVFVKASESHFSARDGALYVCIVRKTGEKEFTMMSETFPINYCPICGRPTPCGDTSNRSMEQEG